MRKVALALALVCASACQTRALTPGDLSRVTFQQHPGVQISPDLVFRDQHDRPFRLGDHFGKQPTILVLGYYRCPMLCYLINVELFDEITESLINVGR